MEYTKGAVHAMLFIRYVFPDFSVSTPESAFRIACYRLRVNRRQKENAIKTLPGQNIYHFSSI
jgi:hypothetical protein